MLNNVQFEAIKYNVINSFVGSKSANSTELEMEKALHETIVEVVIAVLKQYDKLKN